MGWVTVTFVACILLVTISVIFTYLNAKKKFRIIYIVVSAAVSWLLYMLSVYFVVYRPLRLCLVELSEHQMNSENLLCREELNEVNRVVNKVQVEMGTIENDLKKLKGS